MQWHNVGQWERQLTCLTVLVWCDSLTWFLFCFTAQEEDVFQCGKCKRKFTNLSQFFGHKQNECIAAEQSSDTTANSSNVASVHNAGITNTNVIYTTQLAHPQPNKQITVVTSLFCHIQHLAVYWHHILVIIGSFLLSCVVCSAVWIFEISNWIE